MELKEAINCLENMISDYVISAYCEECSEHDNCTEDCYFRIAIDTVLSALDERYNKGYQDGFKQAKFEVEMDKLDRR